MNWAVRTAVQVDAEAGAIDEVRRGEVVDAVPVGTILEHPGDHVGRVTEIARLDRRRRGGRADQAGAPQPGRRSGSDHTPGACRGSLHQHAAIDVGRGDLDGRVGEVEPLRAPTVVLAHRQHAGVGRLARERLGNGIDQIDVLRSAGQGVCGSGEGANDVDDHDSTPDVGHLPPRQEPSA